MTTGITKEGQKMCKDTNFRNTLRDWFEERLREKNRHSDDARSELEMNVVLRRDSDNQYETYDIHLKWVECEAIYEWSRDQQLERDQTICGNLELEMCVSKPGTKEQKDIFHGINKAKEAIRNQFRQ